MQLLNLLPKFIRRHKVIQLLIFFKLQQKIIELFFNCGSRAFIDISDPEPRNVYIKREYDTHFFSITSCFLPEQGIFFDLGANHGLCTFGLLPKYSQIDFHLFEANSFLVQLLSKSIELHSGNTFHLNHACISDQNGFTKFYLEEKQSGQSHVATNSEKGINIKNLVLDDYCIAKKIEMIDFAKIDLEGHEFPALRGWEIYLTQKKVRAIYIEIIPENQNRYGLNTNEPLKFLESFGYDLFLCKSEDFNTFGDKTKVIRKGTNMLKLSKFNAIDYPQDYATDILALASKLTD